MLTILIGRAKTGKSGWILEKIRALGDTSRQILLVPEHASHQAEIDLCRVCGDTASRHAEVLSFRRLGDRVLSVTGGAAQVTLDAGGKLLNLQKALLEVSAQLTVYRRPSRKAAFLQQLLALFDELRNYEVTPELLDAQAREISGATGNKLADLSLLYAAYESRLRRPGLDARDHMTKLCEHLEESHYIDDKDIFLDGFTYFNAQERRVLHILFKQARSVTITLLGEEHRRTELFETSLKTREQLIRLSKQAGCPCEIQYLKSLENLENLENFSENQKDSALDHVERYFFGDNQIFAGKISSNFPIRIYAADTIYSEVERTAASIRTLVIKKRCRYRDITVAARNMPDYESMIETIFERYEIPVYLSRRSDMLEKPVWSLITGVLSSLENGFEYEEMFRWLKTGLAGLTPSECDQLENYVLTWEIHGQMWIRDIDWTDHPDGYGVAWTEEQQKEIEQINLLRRRIQEPLSKLWNGLKTDACANEKINALYRFLEDLKLQESLELQMETQNAAGRMREAEETAQLWEILCSIFDQFVEILGDEPMELEEFSRLLRQVAAQYSVGTIPVSLDQVNVAGIDRNDRHTTRYLFLLGANDHVIPAVEKNSGILNEGDREELAQRGIQLAPSGMDRMDIELQNLYAALVQPTECLIISYPISDISGSELRPAFIISRLLQLFPGLQIRQESNQKIYRLTAPLPALETAGETSSGPLWNYLSENPEFQERMLFMKQASAICRGSLSRSAVQALYGKEISMTASKLERLRSCHFSYFMEYGLRAKPRKTAAFDAPQIGTFLHYLLEHVTADVLSRGGFHRVKKREVRALTRKYIELYIEQILHGLQERTARFKYLFGRLRQTAYAIIEQIAEELECSDFIPLAFELTFGRNKDLPEVHISEPDTELRIRGKVDRVDGWIKDHKLYLRVIDYKSGRKAFDLASVKLGLDIQMLLYLFTLQKEGAQKFGMEVEPAGVLYVPARDDILSTERNILPNELQREREKELRRTGLLLSDPEVLQAMEHDALHGPRFLPIRVSKDGNIGGSIASAAQLGKLGKYIENLLHRIAREVRDGIIDADPWCRSEDDSFCKYCDWASACHFQEGRDTDHYQYIYPVKPEKFWDELEHDKSGRQEQREGR